MGALCSQQLDAIAPLFFSLHDLGEYEACQAELPALLAFDPGPRPRTSCSLASGDPETKLLTPELASMTQFFRTLFEFLPRSGGHSALPLAVGCWFTLMLSTVSVVARGSVFW